MRTILSEPSSLSAYSLVPAPVRHPYVKWAEAVVGVLNSDVDPKTELLWSQRHAQGVSVGVLRAICDRVNIPSGRTLWLARLLRALLLAKREGGIPEDFLDADTRTVKKVLGTAGLEHNRFHTIGPTEFLLDQRLIANSQAIDQLTRSLGEQK